MKQRLPVMSGDTDQRAMIRRRLNLTGHPLDPLANLNPAAMSLGQ
jgi:hypothetical protein